MMTENEAIQYIENFTWSTTRLGLERTRNLLARLGNPQKQLKFVHVAGSNGKGSFCAMMASVLQKAGYRTGLYISPHLVRFTERFSVNGIEMTGEELAEITEKVRAAADEMEDHPSQFELSTAIAMEFFARKACDIVVLEVGMGGELDSTNVIDAPELAVIMNIGLEHTEYLGKTLAEIATAKGGIIKPGCSAICYPSGNEVTDTLKAICRERGVGLRCVDFGNLKEVKRLAQKSSDLREQSLIWDGKLYKIRLLGAYQLKNAAMVIESVKILRERGWEISDSDLEEGLAEAKWPARFEVLSRNPLFILDGGHNPQCASALAESLDAYLPEQKFTFLMGVLADKDYAQIIETMLPFADSFVCVTPDSPRALSAEDLALEIVGRGISATPYSDINEAISAALEPGKPVVAFGSLYMAGKIRQTFLENFVSRR